VTEQAIRRDLTPFEVAAFLRRNPDFLSGFPELAFVLTIPREHGASTTLASYQLEVLRDKNRAMHRRLNELVAIAQENEQLMVRVHAFTLALMRAASAAETLERTCAVLSEDFQGDLVRLVLFGANPLPAAPWLLALERDARALQPFAEFLAAGEPLCGRLLPEKLALLFGADGEHVRSAVLLPIPGHGMLAVGSRDGNRFHPGMGTMFLKLMSDAVAAALTRYPPREANQP
jgi:uncharacterized protein YigA (DUF484 family)